MSPLTRLKALKRVVIPGGPEKNFPKEGNTNVGNPMLKERKIFPKKGEF